MKIKKGYVLREVANQYIVVPTGNEALNFNGIITLNKTGKFLWELLQTPQTKETLVSSLLAHYNVTHDVANVDVEEFINNLQKKNILE